ncbi:MAG TPA: hypothetical protein VFR05_10490, partial [Terriglobia bacterium]|nr:hypothetical protein [Terriglobia bacterium]
TEPTPVIVLSSGSLEPGQQATISLNVTAFPRELNDPMNLLTVTFVPSTSGAPMDPAVQFATGGRQVSFVIRANATTAEFQGLSGPLGFQAGTVAGTLTFRMTFRNKAGQIKTATAIANVARRPPTVTRVAATKNTDGFETAITLHSSPREVATLRLHFNLAQQVRMSCGNIPGCTVFGTIVTFNVSSLFSDWYAGNNDHGTLAMIRIPFLLDSSIKGTVLISTSNAMGSSNVMTLQLP